MSVFKCKMCGGDLTVTQEMTVCECQYCGSKQTLPRISDEKKNNLYDRAGHFRRNNEYDKAMAIYEQILNEDTEDAESYWSIVLCKYGIEYVEDPATHRRVPTVNRAQLTSVFMDENYKSALKYADSEQRAVYEAEAREIEQIQKGILEISSKEEPFDVFICYKESDASGRRTPDSVLANDLYHQLTQEGFKVFFARITLEDKLGSAYEPYIFAALNSAKVMVVLGTRPEYFSAVWVKNEWSRFLTQIKGGAKKALIPAYKDMDPYDLPEEFSHLQAQDMSKLGFMQDLIRGIKKLVGTDEKQSVNKSTVIESGSAYGGAQALVERAFLFLEDGEFARADELCEQALNQDPKNAKAYVGKLMVERKLRKQEELSKGTEMLTENNYFQKALRFAEEGLKKELDRCNEMIMDNKKELTYNQAMKLVRESGVQGGVEAAIEALNQAIAKYESLLGWRDSAEQIEACRAKKNAHFDKAYQDAMKLMKTDSSKLTPNSMLNVMSEAIEKLEFLKGYQYLDSKKLLSECIDKKREYEEIIRKKREEIRKKQAEEQAEIRKKEARCIAIGSVVVLLIVAMIAGTVAFTRMVRNKLDGKRYDNAVAAMQEGEYGKAVRALENINGETYKNNLDNEISKVYKEALEKYEAGNYDEAERMFEEFGEYEESEIYLNLTLAKKLIAQGNYVEAEEYFNILGELGRDTSELTYQKALAYMENGEYDKAIEAFSQILDYKDAQVMVQDVEKFKTYQEALKYMENEKYDKAMEAFSTILDYKDVKDRIKEARVAIMTSVRQMYPYTVKKMISTGGYRGFHTVGLKSDGTVMATGSNNFGQCNVSSWEGIVEIAVGEMHTVGLKLDGTVIATGANGVGQCNVSGWKDIVEIYAVGNCTVGLKSDGTVMATGSYGYYEFDVSSWKDIVEISVGRNRIMGLKSDGTVVASGDIGAIYGQGDVSRWYGIKEIAAGEVGLKADGTVVTTRPTDLYDRHEVNWWKDIVEIAVGDSFTVGLKSDGTVVMAMDCDVCDLLYDVSWWKDIVEISVGEGFIVGLKSDGTVVVESENNAYYDDYDDEFDVSSWKDIVEISVGTGYIVGLKKDGTVVATGYNEDGRCNVSGWEFDIE